MENIVEKKWQRTTKEEKRNQKRSARKATEFHSRKEKQASAAHKRSKRKIVQAVKRVNGGKLTQAQLHAALVLA